MSDTQIMKGLFYTLYRKFGFSHSLTTLASYPGGRCRVYDFYRRLKEKEGYINEFLRVRADLLKYKLVSYSLDEEFEKTIGLTPKGEKVLELIRNLMELFAETQKTIS